MNTSYQKQCYVCICYQYRLVDYHCYVSNCIVLYGVDTYVKCHVSCWVYWCCSRLFSLNLVYSIFGSVCHFFHFYAIISLKFSSSYSGIFQPCSEFLFQHLDYLSLHDVSWIMLDVSYVFWLVDFGVGILFDAYAVVASYL